MRRFASQYLDFFRLPDVATLMGVALLSRMPIGMVGLAMLMFLREALGSYALAGTVSGVYFVAMAVGAPIQGRLIDRSGPKLTLAVTGVVHPLSLLAILLASRAGAGFRRRGGGRRARRPLRDADHRAHAHPLAPPLHARGGPPPRLLRRRGADRGELHAGPRHHRAGLRVRRRHGGLCARHRRHGGRVADLRRLARARATSARRSTATATCWARSRNRACSSSSPRPSASPRASASSRWAIPGSPRRWPRRRWAACSCR